MLIFMANCVLRHCPLPIQISKYNVSQSKLRSSSLYSRHHDTEAEEVGVWLTDAAQTDSLHFIIHAKYKWHLGQRMYHNGRGFSYNL